MHFFTSRRVIRVPPIEDGQARPTGSAFLRPAAVTTAVQGGACRHLSTLASSVPMVFHMEDDLPPDPEMETDPVSPSARQARETVARLLAPGRTEQALFSSAVLAVQASGGDLEGTAQVLTRLGYIAQVCTAKGGTLHRLRHSFISVASSTGASAAAAMPGGSPSGAIVVDPAFAQAFAVTNPTPRFSHILTALPPVLVAPLTRVAWAVVVLGEELACCFEQRGLPLPPWRHTDAILSKYEAATSAAAHVSPAESAHSPGGAPEAAPTHMASALPVRTAAKAPDRIVCGWPHPQRKQQEQHHHHDQCGRAASAA